MAGRHTSPYSTLMFESLISVYRPYNVYCFIFSKNNNREESIPMTALWCPAFSNHG